MPGKFQHGHNKGMVQHIHYVSPRFSSRFEAWSLRDHNTEKNKKGISECLFAESNEHGPAIIRSM